MDQATLAPKTVQATLKLQLRLPAQVALEDLAKVPSSPKNRLRLEALGLALASASLAARLAWVIPMSYA
ncbi:MAG: hypothetical protein R6W06_13855 [Prochlorococcaceae cyanobacterium]